jgi:starvation-inducible outer membrane lipoprotein
VEAIRFETTVGQGGTLTVPNVEEGERVEVIVLKLGPAKKPVRKGGWIKGKIVVHPGFDDPVPGMEEYL